MDAAPVIGVELQGRYRILDQLGSGGMGEVYLAQHTRLDRLEAVKVLKPSVAGQWAGRFRREARAMNRLCHPNIIAVYDFGQLDDGRFFLSMEYAEGGSVKDVIQFGGRFDTDRTLTILMQLADAVDHAHEKGVIHRDLKPANMILVKRDGPDPAVEQLKILDFGVAKILWEDADAGAGTGNLILGTPAYMAPELFSGVGDDPRSDIYAIGCIGFELLSGRPPFAGRPLEIADQHMAMPAPRPSDFIADGHAPKELEDVIAWCLQKKPGERPQTGSELAGALRGVIRVLRQHNRSQLARSTLKNKRLRSVPGKFEDDTATESFVQAFTGTDLAQEREMAAFEFRLVLKRLGECVVDAGCTDAKLLLTLANVNRADGDLARAGSEIKDLHRENERDELELRERQSSLRFSIGELDYARMHSTYSGEDAAAMLETIAQLHAQLRQIESEFHQRDTHRQEREIELVARQSNLEEMRDRMYQTLDELLADLAPAFRPHSGAVAELMDFIAERRALLAAANSASSLPLR